MDSVRERERGRDVHWLANHGVVKKKSGLLSLFSFSLSLSMLSLSVSKTLVHVQGNQRACRRPPTAAYPTAYAHRARGGSQALGPAAAPAAAHHTQPGAPRASSRVATCTCAVVSTRADSARAWARTAQAVKGERDEGERTERGHVRERREGGCAQRLETPNQKGERTKGQKEKDKERERPRHYPMCDVMQRRPGTVTVWALCR